MGKSVDGRIQTLVRFHIEQLDNETFLATLVAHSNGSVLPTEKPYDDEGALYYVVAVVFIYGFSIILMIGSLIKRNKNDNGVGKYMKDMDKVRRMERRQQKYQTRLAMSAAGGSRRASRALAASSRGFHLSDTGPMSAPAGSLASNAFSWDATSAEHPAGSELFNTASSGSLTSNPTENSSPRQPLLGRQQPGKPVPISPALTSGCRRESVTTAESTENEDVFITEYSDITNSEYGDVQSREQMAISSLPVVSPHPPSTSVEISPRKVSCKKAMAVYERQSTTLVGGVSPGGIGVPGGASGPGDVSTPAISFPTNDTVLFIDGDEKCKVSLTQHMALSPQVSLSPSVQLGTVHEVEEQEEHTWCREMAGNVYEV